MMCTGIASLARAHVPSVTVTHDDYHQVDLHKLFSKMITKGRQLSVAQPFCKQLQELMLVYPMRPSSRAISYLQGSDCSE